MLICIKYQEIKHFSGLDNPRMLFFLLIKVEMPTIVGISTFMSKKKFMLSLVEHEKSFITSGHGIGNSVSLTFEGDEGMFGRNSCKLNPLTLLTINIICGTLRALKGSLGELEYTSVC